MSQREELEALKRRKRIRELQAKSDTQAQAVTAREPRPLDQRIKVPEFQENPILRNARRGVNAVSRVSNSALFGLPRRAASTVNGLANIAQGQPANFTAEHDKLKDVNKRLGDDFPISSGASSLAGFAVGGLGLAKAGLTATSKIPQALGGAKGLLATIGAGAVDGTVIAGAESFIDGDSKEEIGNRSLMGALGGGAGAGIIKGAGALFQPLKGVFNSKGKAQAMLRKTLQRSGQSADDVATRLREAAADGTPEFALMDALGDSGKKLTGVVARTPSRGSEKLTKFLDKRQLGQGDRLSQGLSTALNQTDETAEEVVTRLSLARDVRADQGYNAARANAGAVNVSSVLKTIDDEVSPSAFNLSSDLRRDTIAGALSKYRSMLSNGREQLSDFAAILNVRKELGDEIFNNRGTNKARVLGKVLKSIDDSMESASDGYKAARNQFRADSRVINSVADGVKITQPRVRHKDANRLFAAALPDEQQSLRTGAADNLLKKIENARPGVNKAAQFETDKLDNVLGKLSSDNGKFARNIGREQTMFDTRHNALGGSQTAGRTNADLDFDGVINGTVDAVTGNHVGLARRGVQALGRGLSGETKAVRNRLADSLMQTNPDVVMRELATAVRSGQKLTLAQSTALNTFLIGLSQSETNF